MLKERNKGFSNRIDKLITSCQYNQTHGIPTGNILSRIISELYMCYIDSEMENKDIDMRDTWMTYHSHLILKKRKINFTGILTNYV